MPRYDALQKYLLGAGSSCREVGFSFRVSPYDPRLSYAATGTCHSVGAFLARIAEIRGCDEAGTMESVRAFLTSRLGAMGTHGDSSPHAGMGRLKKTAPKITITQKTPTDELHLLLTSADLWKQRRRNRAPNETSGVETGRRRNSGVEAGLTLEPWRNSFVGRGVPPGHLSLFGCVSDPSGSIAGLRCLCN